MKITNEELQILRGISITTILGLHKSNERRISIRCPFPGHRDSSPSFVLYPKNSYHCFGCNKSGQGAIDFCMALGFSFEESLIELSKYV